MLLIPVVLFLIGQPNKPPDVQAANVGGDLGGDTHKTEIATFLAMGPPSLNQLTAIFVSANEQPGGAREMAWASGLQPYFRGKGEIEFTTLEGCARTPELQNAWKGSIVSVRGQYAPDRGGNPRVFSLARLKINCCAPDAIQLNVPILAKEPVQNIRPNDWVLVTGEISFFTRNGEVRSMLRVHNRGDVVKTKPDANPYLAN